MSVQQLQQEILALPASERALFVRWVKQLDENPTTEVLHSSGECPIWSPYDCAEAGEALLAALKAETPNA